MDSGYHQYLDIYYIVDTGKQMQGDKIGSVNSALEEAIAVDLPDVAAAMNDVELRVAVMQFSDGASWVTPSSGPIGVGDVIWNDLHSSGANDFGAALNLLEDRFKKDDCSTYLSPIVTVFSNAPVTDDYEKALERLNQIALFQDSIRIGIAIGADADRRALTMFTGSSDNVLAVNDKHTLKALTRKQRRKTRNKKMIDLKSILKQHPNCLNSRASFKSALMDKYPTEKRAVNILTILFECGVANRIKAKKSIDANEMQMLITQVENEYGISGQYSQEAILIWAAAFDVTASAIKTQSPIAAPKEQTKPVEQKPVVYVQGDIDDYDVVQKSDGYYITHFNGFEEDEMTIPSMIDGKKIKGIAQDAFKGCVLVKSVQISEGIEVIENRAFYECKALEKVSLPDTLQKIGTSPKGYQTGAFSYTNLKEIIIPQNVSFLGASTFTGCRQLKKVVLSDNITIIHDHTFSFCSSLIDLKLPSKLSSIGYEAFYNSGVKVIHLPLGTKKILRDAFKGSNLSEIYIPPTVIDIGSSEGYSLSFIDSTFGEGYKRSGLTIYCAAGSTAMEYARKNNIKCAKAQF